MLQVVFDQDADIYKARQAVKERLQQVTSQLPEGTHTPEISPLVSPLGTILQYAFTVNGQGQTSLMDLRRLVETTLSNQILSVAGVSQVTIYGGDERQEQVLVNPDKLKSLNVSLNEVTQATRGANSNLLSIVASTLVAMTLSPALCAILLAHQRLPQETSFISRLAERLYRPLLNIALQAPKLILGIALASLVATIAIAPSLGRVFLPEFQEKSMVNSMVLFPGVSLDMTNRAGMALSKSLEGNPLYEWVQGKGWKGAGGC